MSWEKKLVQALLGMFRVDMTRQDLADVLDAVLVEATALTGARKGSIHLLTGGELRCVAARDAAGRLERAGAGQVSTTVVQRCLATGEPVHVPAVYQNELAGVPSLYQGETSSLLCVPIRRGADRTGVLYLDQGPGGAPFGERERDTLLLFAEGVAIAIANAGAYDSLRRAVSLVEGADRFCGMLGRHPAMQRVFRQVQQIASSALDPPVLIRGESGTGKELVARALHLSSARRAARFVPVNCAAIPAELFESQLFGHRKGSFTGAVEDRAGTFEAAAGGTVFLDEVGELPPALQAKLLRVLQEKVVTPVGSLDERPVDVWVLSATHQDLPRRIAEGRFREDLYYRIHSTAIDLPALRERPDDLPLLIAAFSGDAPPPVFSPEVERVLRAHRWPGNVRELKNLVDHLAIFARGRMVTLADLPPELAASAGAPPPAAAAAPASPAAAGGGESGGVEAFLASHTLDQVKAAAIEAAIRAQVAGRPKARLNKSELAEKLGVTRKTVQHLLDRLGVDPDRVIARLRDLER